MSHPIAVIGAGLSGLYASYLLAQAGHKVLLIEARERIGGRILSQGLAGASHRIDLGPSWFWPGMNPRIERLVIDFGLGTYPQHTRGAYTVEAPDGRVHRQHSAWVQSPSSWRIAGGMQSLVEALHARIESQVHLLSGTRLLRLKLRPHGVELELEDSRGSWTQTAAQVVLTTPPRLTAQDLRMEPPWPEALLKDMHHTPTWMAGQAKFAAIYPRAFWRDAGWSGAAMSNRGPMIEIHDASDASGESAALFGFVRALPAYRAGIGRVELERRSLEQLVRIFGDQAGQPMWATLQDWAIEPMTAASADQQPLAYHPVYRESDVPIAWTDRLWLAGSERSANHGGYLEGALESAEEAVRGLLNNRPLANVITNIHEVVKTKKLHADMSQRVAVHAAKLPWLASPIAGVERRLLHRVGDEVAQATSFVRYAPGSQFSAHTHTGGEEFLVIEGVFKDEHGEYPAGSYIRNPPQSRHTPGSAPGATIFVKLWQFDLQDRTHVRVHADKLARIADASRPGVQVSPLFKDVNEDVRMELWAANSRVELDLPDGGEFLLLDGGFSEGGEQFAPQSWLRLPRASRLQADTGRQGAKVWVKLGHMAFQTNLKLPVQ